MQAKDKIEKEYQDYLAAIEKMAQEELKQIKEKASKIKAEANIVGEDVEKSLRNEETKSCEKKS